MGAGHRRGPCNRGPEAFGGLVRTFLGRFAHEDEEFLAPQPAEDIVGTLGGTKRAGDLLQQQVAGTVARVVIDLLEAVDVEEREGEASAVPRGVR
jgi:hypothetical protein